MLLAVVRAARLSCRNEEKHNIHLARGWVCWLPGWCAMAFTGPVNPSVRRLAIGKTLPQESESTAATRAPAGHRNSGGADRLDAAPIPPPEPPW
jgi:hypothetical protein